MCCRLDYEVLESINCVPMLFIESPKVSYVSYCALIKIVVICSAIESDANRPTAFCIDDIWFLHVVAAI